MPLDLQRDKEAWPWLEVRGDSVEVGPGDYKHSEVKFDDIVLFGEYFSRSEDESGLSYVIVTQSRIGFIPWDVPRCEELLAALSQHWGVDLSFKDEWKNYDSKRGADARILWLTRYLNQPLFQYSQVSPTGVAEKLMRVVAGPEWEAPSLSALANRLLAAKESTQE